MIPMVAVMAVKTLCDFVLSDTIPFLVLLASIPFGGIGEPGEPLSAQHRTSEGVPPPGREPGRKVSKVPWDPEESWPSKRSHSSV